MINTRRTKTTWHVDLRFVFAAMVSLLLAILTTGLTSAGCGERTSKDTQAAVVRDTPLAVRFADAVLARWPDPTTITNKCWEYNNGIVLHGIAEVYEKTRDPRYLDYVRRFVDAYVDEQGHVDLGMDHNLDRIQPAMLLVFLLEKTGLPKYRTAAVVVRARFEAFPRNEEGGFWHKTKYPNEMWLDGIYMAEPFLVRYGRQIGDAPFCFDTAVFQTTLLAKHVQDPKTGLLRHAWDQDRNAHWADPTTGVSPEVWSRGAGWCVMALVDMLQNLPPSHPGYAKLQDILRLAAKGLRATQDPQTGLWYQVVDKGDRKDNWHETSGSGMFVYALKTGVDAGHLESGYLEVARKGWEGVKSRITFGKMGEPVISDAVEGMGVQADYANYVNKMRVSNSTHGLCAIMLAASRMETIHSVTPQ